MKSADSGPSKNKKMNGKSKKKTVDDTSKRTTVDGISKRKLMESPSQDSKGKSNSKGKEVISKKIPTCPWTLHVSPGINDDKWVVKTLIEDHKCIHSRELSCCNSTFLSQHVSELVKSRPEIRAKGMKELLSKQQKLGIKTHTVYRAKQKASKKMKGDFQEQNNLLRDYILELQERNPDTIVKLEEGYIVTSY